MLFKDQLHREIHLTKTPQRIVSLVPSQTELLFNLGLEEQLVGITKFCVHPLHIRKSSTVVGGTKQVNYEKIKPLRPDLIICNKEENTEGMISELEKIAPVWISDISSISESTDMINSLGVIFKVQNKARNIIEVINEEKRRFIHEIQNRPIKKVAYLIWQNPLMAAGKNTFISEMLTLNRFENIITGERYPEVYIDELKNAELVLLSSEPYPFKEEDMKSLSEQIPGEVKLVDGEYFSWYGSRLQDAFAYFRTLN